MKTIVNRSDAALLAVDERGMILEFNNRVTRFLEIPSTELKIGGNLDELDVTLHWREALAGRSPRSSWSTGREAFWSSTSSSGAEI